MITERILLMGPPAAGKTFQVLQVYQYLIEQGIQCHIIDLEDKMEAAISGSDLPLPEKFDVTLSWEDYAAAVDSISLPPNSWIFVDRIDLSWSMIQRWFTQQKYGEELSTRLLKKSQGLKKSSMFIPTFDQGSWQVINENYESTMLKLLYRSRCNALMTCGIKGIDEDNPLDVFAHLGVTARGQKELPHQPHSVFLLSVKKRGRDLSWHITTAKDLKNRVWFDNDDCYDFYLQYVAEHWKP